MQVKDTLRVPETLVELNKALGNVWAIAWPWDELPSIAENAGAPAATHRQPQKASLEEIAWSDETVQRFARWLDFRSERLNERSATSSDDYQEDYSLTPLSDILMLRSRRRGEEILSTFPQPEMNVS